MKAFILLLALASFTLAAQPLQAQTTEKERPDQVAFDEAFELYEDGACEKAMLAFSDFMERFPRSPLRPRAHYNVGHICMKLHYNAKAAAVFKEILNQDYNETDENTLMEPYALYKHHSCRNLAEIYLEEKDFAQAESYITMFDKVYPYQHFCGNEWAAYDIYKATMYAKLYEGKGDYKKAVRTLIPLIFENGLASNRELMKDLIDLLHAHYTNDDVRAELQHALSTLTVKNKKRGDVASITLYGEKVDVFSFAFEEQPVDVEGYRKFVMRNGLFEEFL